MMKTKKIHKKCEQCLNNFIRPYQCEREWRKARFCSLKCRLQQKQPKWCLVCNKKFLKMGLYSVKSWEEKALFCTKQCQNIFFRSEGSPHWKGGVTAFQRSIRTCQQYLTWRKTVILRDKGLCVLCNDSEFINVDHIKPLIILLKENSIITLNDARVCSALWDVSNGRVLCVNCHRKTDTYSRRPNVALSTRKAINIKR